MEQEGTTVAALAAVQAAQTAAAQGERLAVVETEVKTIREDLTIVKTDVKTLLASSNRFQGGTGLITRLAPWVALAVSVAVAMKGS